MADKIPQNIDECFLLDFMPEVAIFRDITNINKQSEHVIVLDEQHSGNSQLFLNKLIDPEYQTLMDGCPKNLFQHLSPMVNMYKVFYDPADPLSESESIKFQFGKFDPLKTRQAIEELRGEYGDTAALYGGFRPGHLAPSITEANIVFDGQNPAEASSFVKANLKLYFPSADALFFKRTVGSRPISFSNLIERPSVPKGANSQASSEDNHRVYSQENFRIKMELFYLPKDSTFLKDDKLWGSSFPMDRRRGIMELINNNRLTLYLNIVKHEFSFDHDNVNLPFYLNVQYIGAVESAMNTKAADILKDPERDRKLAEIRKTPEYRNYQAAKSAATGMGLANLVNSKANMDSISHRNKANAADTSAEYFITPERVRDLQAATLERNLGMVGVELNVEGVKYGDDMTAETLEAVKAETTAWAKLGVEWDVRKSLGLQHYAEAKRAYDALLNKEGMLEEQQLSRGYSRIIKELYGGEAAKAAAMAGNMEALRKGVKYVYSVGVPGTQLKDYLSRREGRKLDQETQKDLKELEKNGDTIAAKRLRLEREASQNDVRTFYKQFWKKLGQVKPKTAARRADIIEAKEVGVMEGSGGSADASFFSIEAWGDDDYYAGASSASALGIQEKLRRIARLQAAGKSPEQLSELLKKLSTKSEAPLNSGEQIYQVDYFYLGDLMDIVLRNVHASNKGHRLNLYSDSEYRGKKPDAKDLKDKTLFILGNITWNDFASNSSKTISLDRLPVSMTLFMEFWTEKVVKRQRKSYPLNEFVKDVMTNLVKAVFTNKCRVEGEPTNNISCKLQHVSLNPDIAGDPTINITPSQTVGDPIPDPFPAENQTRSIESTISIPASVSLIRPTKTQIVRAAKRAEGRGPSIANIAELGSSNSKIRKRAQRVRSRRSRWEKNSFEQLKTTEIMYMYVTNSKPDHLQGNRKKDVESGVMHIEVGNPNTPLKEVNFNKSDQPFYLEAKGETAGLKDNSMELSEPYNLDLTLYGLTYARPGQHFYLKLKNFGDPSQKRVRGRTVGFGLEYSLQASPARRLGLGGYYMMNKVEQNFRAEGGRTYWETLTQALWTSFGDQKAENNKTLNNTTSPVANEGDQTMGGVFATMVNSTAARIDAKLANANITSGGGLTKAYVSTLVGTDPIKIAQGDEQFVNVVSNVIFSNEGISALHDQGAKGIIESASSPIIEARTADFLPIIKNAQEEAKGDQTNPAAFPDISTSGASADPKAKEIRAKHEEAQKARLRENSGKPVYYELDESGNTVPVTLPENGGGE